MTTEIESDSDLIAPGTYYERNAFPEDGDVVNREIGHRAVIMDNATAEQLDIAMTVLMPLNEELTEEGLIKRVIGLHKNNWLMLIAPWEHVRGWRRELLGPTLYRQMKHFKIFVGVVPSDQRDVHFFMVEKTPQFKRGLRRLAKHMKGVSSGALDAEMMKRLFCIIDGGKLIIDGSQSTLTDGDDVNFLGCAKSEDREFQINNILAMALE